MRVSTKHLLVPVGLGLLAASLSGCVVAPPVDTAWSDPEAYLASNFSPSALSPDLAAHVAATAPSTAQHFRKLIVHGKMTRTSNLDNEQAPLSNDYIATFYPQPDQKMVNLAFEIFSNGLPSGMNFSTGLDGLLALRIQTARANAWNYNGNVSTMQSVEKWPVLNPISEGGEYNFDYHWGRENSLAGVPNFFHCKADHFYPASQINAALTGNAIEITCEEGAAITTTRTTYSYLSDYNVSLAHKQSTVQRVWDYQVNSVELVR